MDNFDEYEFKLEAYTPQTIPMERLAKYLAALAKLFGNEASIHLSRLEAGSTCPIMSIDIEAIPKIEERLNGLGSGEAANDARMAFDEINKLCAADNATGALYGRNMGVRDGNVVVLFEGRNLPKRLKFGPFTEQITFDGELIRIGGKDKTAHAQLVDPEGVIWNGEMTKDLAANIAQYLYKGLLRVSGRAKWIRDEDGHWIPISLVITEFLVLDDDSLFDATNKLRSLKETDWHNIDDVDSFLNDSRGNDEVLH